MTHGQVVISKCGRDKGLAMVVTDIQGEYLLLVDGKLRILARPKKKKLKHVQPTHYKVEMTPICGRTLQDADIRRGLRQALQKVKIVSAVEPDTVGLVI